MATKKRNSIPLADTGIDWSSPVGEPTLINPAVPEAPQEQPSGMLRRAVGDTGVSLVKSAIGVPETMVGMADLVTGGRAGKLVQGAGLDFKAANEAADTLYSPEFQAASKKVQAADGVVNTLRAAFENPSTIYHGAVTSLGSMLTGAPVGRMAMLAGTTGAARAAMAAAPAAERGAMLAATTRTPGWLAGAAAEGASSAGQNAEQVRQSTKDGLLTGEQSAILAASGLLTAGITAVAGRIANKLGIGDINQMIAGAQQAGPAVQKGLARKLAEGFATEGVLQEFPQSWQEQVAQNIAQGKPWDEGAANAAVMGGLSGGLLGAGAAPFGHGGAEPVVDPGQAIRDKKLPEGGPMTRAANAATEAQARAADAGAPTMATMTAEQEARALSAIERQGGADAKGLRQFATSANAAASGRPMPGMPPAPAGQPSTEASATVTDMPFGDRVLTLREQLADPTMRQALRDTFGDEALNQATYYSSIADRPDIPMPDRTRDNMLAMAERMVSLAVLKPTGRPGLDGPGPAAPQLEGPDDGPARIGLDTRPTGVMRADAAGNVAPETQADAIDTRNAVASQTRDDMQARRASVVRAEPGTPPAPPPPAPPAPPPRAARTPRADAVAIDPAAPNAVARFIAQQSTINTPAARAFVQDYRAGRVTDADVLARIQPKTAPTADERIAAAAAQAPKPELGLILNREGRPFTHQRAATAAQRANGGDVVQVPGGWAVRPADSAAAAPPASTQEPSHAQTANVPAPAAPAADQEGADQAGDRAATAPAAGAAGTGAGTGAAVEADGVKAREVAIAAFKRAADAKMPGRDHQRTAEMIADRLLPAIEEKNADAILAMNLGSADMNPGSRSAFEAVTGVRLPNGRAASERAIDEWAGVTEQQRAEKNAAKRAAIEAKSADRDLQAAKRAAAAIQVKDGERSVDGASWVDELRGKGFTTVVRRGPKTYLANADGNGWPMMHKDIAEYARKSSTAAPNAAAPVEAGSGSAAPAPAAAAPAAASGALIPDGLSVTFGGKTYPVVSVEDAQRKWVQFQESADGGMAAGVSQIGNGIPVLDGAGRLVARVAYNGRAFDPAGHLIAEAPGRTPMPPGVRADTAQTYIPPRETLEQARERSARAISASNGTEPSAERRGPAPTVEPESLAALDAALASGKRVHFDYAGEHGRTLWVEETPNGWVLKDQDDGSTTIGTKGGGGQAGGWSQSTALRAARETAEFRFTKWKPKAAQSNTPPPATGGNADKPGPAKPEAAPSANTIFTEDAAAAARARLKAKLGRLNSGLDPETMMDGITLAGYHIEKGARRFAAFARAMVDDLGNGVKPYLQSWYMAVRGDPRAVGFKADMDKASAVEDLNVDEVLAATAPAAPEPATIPKRVTDSIDRLLQPVKDLADALDRARQTDAKFGGAGRYGAETWRDLDGDKRLATEADALKNALDSIPDAGNRAAAAAYIEAGRARPEQTAAEAGYFAPAPNKDASPAEGATTGPDAATSPAKDDTQGQEAADDSPPPSDTPALDKPLDAGQRPVEDGATRGARQPRSKPGRADDRSVRGPRDAGGRSDDEGRNVGDGRGDAVVPDGAADAVAGSGGRVHAPDFRPGIGGLKREGSWHKTAARNLDLIDLARKIESEGRPATPDEQAQLAKYVGFGASEIRNGMFPVPQDYHRRAAPAGTLIFPEAVYDAKWTPLAERAAALPVEWQRTILQSTQYAHYTSEGIIRSVWSAVQRLGFTGGKVFEPGGGIGSFAMLMPDAVRQTSKFTGIEFDGPTALIARLLSPEQNMLHDDFIKRRLPDSFFDAVVGNPPFSQTPITADPRYQKYGFMLHDYFFAKALDKLRPGGVLAFVTSKGTMDKKTDKARRYLMERADLVGAIRLPSTAFEDNAGTSVVTDVIFLRKRMPGEAPGGQPWAGVATVETKDGPVVVNEYFAANPDMVLGQQRLSGNTDDQGRRINSNGMGGAKYTVVSYDTTADELDAKFAAAVEKLPENVYSASVMEPQAQRAEVAKMDFDPAVKREGVVYLGKGGELLRVEDGIGRPLADAVRLSPKDTAWLSDYVGVRDLVKAAQLAQVTDGAWEPALKKLNKAYDAFVKKHGPINAFRVQVRKSTDEEGKEVETPTRVFTNRRLIREDYDSALMTQLESIDEDGNVKKAAFLKDRTIGKPVTREVKSIGDALAVSLDAIGSLNLADVASRLHISRDEAIDALGNQVYKAPGGDWMLADEYLSGNVVDKLAEAQEAARLDRSLERNVEALKAVQPDKLGPSQISVKLGAPWVDAKHVNDFSKEIEAGEVTFDHKTETWQVAGGNMRSERRVGAEFGTAARSPSELLEAILNSRSIKVMQTVANDSGKGTKQITDPEATTAANEAAKKIKEKFKTWVWMDSERAADLVEGYNARYNNLAPRVFDGSHLTLPGVSLRYKLHPHQLRAIWRQIQTGSTYLAHAVGAGKTIEMIAGGMEQKRLGLISKPMYVVPNHMLEQFSNEFMELYPLANIMVADDQNFSKERRKAFVAAATLNAPDAIVITHDAFQRIGVKPESIAPIRDGILADLEEELSSVAKDAGARVRRGQLEQQIESVTQRFDSILAAGKKDGIVDFEDMGVDFIYADEAHVYRKLDFHTAQSIKGIDPNGSRRALDMYIKTRHLDRLRPGRAMVFASGTAVTNTMGEIYTIMRFFDQKTLDEGGIATFDSWSRMFGEVASALEPNAAGKYEVVERFAKFDNVPELMARVRRFMDVLQSDQLGAIVKRPDTVGGKPNLNLVEPSQAMKDYQANVLQPRLERSRAWKPTFAQPNNPDPVIAIISDGRLAATDPRFIPGGRLKPGETTKIDEAAGKIAAEYEATAGNQYVDRDGKPMATKGGTQIVFYNVGFGAASSARRGFDSRGTFTKAIVAGGVKREHIAWFDDADTDAKKEAIFKGMRNGTYRVLIGSAKKMGTGVNVQNRLTALHYMDPPWFPADVEQPRGRIIRQGNQNPLVREEWYATRGGYDSTMWQMVGRKQRFIDQAFRGDKNLRSMEDLGEASLYEQAAAMASGDPRALQLAGLRQDTERLERQQAAHASEQINARQAMRNAEWDVEAAQKREATYAAAFKAIGGGYFQFSAGVVAGATITKQTEFGQALKDAFNKGAAAAVLEPARVTQRLGTIGDGMPLTMHAGFAYVQEKGEDGKTTRVKVPSGRHQLTVTAGGYSMDIGDDVPSMGADVDALGLVRKVVNALNSVEAKLRQARADIERSKVDITRLRKKIGAPFEHQQEMLEKWAALKELEEELRLEGLAKPAGPPQGMKLGDAYEIYKAPAEAATMVPGRFYVLNASSVPHMGQPERGFATQAAAQLWADTRPDPTAPPAADQARIESEQMGAWQKESGAITPMFSRADGQQQDQPVSSGRRKAIEALVGLVAARWANAPEIVVVDSLQDPRVPEAVRKEQSAQSKGEELGAPEGFFHDGKVYLVAGQLPGDADVIRVLMHESLGHFGLRGVFGPALGTILDRLAILNAGKVRAKAKQYGLDYDKPSERRIAAEEVLAEMAQATPTIGWAKQAVAAIRTWLRGHVPGFRQMALSDDEIVRSYLLPARAFVQRGGAAGGQGGSVSFSRAKPQTGTEDEARAAGFTMKAYRGVSKAAPFNDSGSTWLTTDRGVAEAYAEEVMGYDDPGVLTVMVKPDGLAEHDASRLTDEQREEMEADDFGNPQAVGIYRRSDDHPLGGSRGNVTVIHAPKSAVFVIDEPGADIRYSRASIAAAVDSIADKFNQGPTIVGQTGRQYTPDQLDAMRNVGFQTEPRTIQERAKALWKDAGKTLAQGLVDQFAPVKDISEKAYGLLRLSKGASGAFEALLQGGKLKLTDGVYDFDAAQRGGVVDTLFKPLQGEHHDFLRWVAANRADRLMGVGKENLFTPDDIAALKSLSAGVAPFDYTIQHGARAGTVTRDRTLIYADSLRTFNAFSANVLDMAEQSGLIDGEARALWENEFYVPFYRVEEDGNIAGANIKNGAVRQQAFRSLTGRTNKLNADLLDNTLMNWAHLLDAGAKNRAAKASIEAAEKMGAAEQVDGPSGKGTVWFRENGDKRYSFVSDPHLLTAISALEYAGMRNPVMNAMGAFKRALTMGVTASPFFKVRNLIRDSVQAVATGSLSYNVASNIAQGWKLTDPSSDSHFRMLAGGGTIHFGTMMEGNEAKRVQALVESGVDAANILDSDKKIKAFYRRYIEPGITAYNELGNRGEEINRASLYDQLVKQGMSHADASLQARDLMDFSLQGSFTSIRFLTQVVPFLNARIQGLYKLGRAAKEDPARFATVLGAVSLMSLALLAGYSDDDDWKKREEWDRNNYWWFKIAGTAIRIPKPFEVGAIATLAERGFELAFDKEMTGKRFRKQVLTLLGDNLAMNPIPQMVKPILDVYANKNSFTGRPIETMGMEKLKPEYRVTERTTAAAKGISAAANAAAGLVGADAYSPVQVDSLLQGYFGWLGSFVIGAGDVLARIVSDKPAKATPDYWKAATGGIVSDLRDAPSRYVSQMYEQAAELEQAYGTWQMLRKQGRTAEAAEFQAEHRDDINLHRAVGHVRTTETRLNGQIRVIQQSDRPADEKRDLIRAIQDRKDRLARTVAPG